MNRAANFRFVYTRDGLQEAASAGTLGGTPDRYRHSRCQNFSKPRAYEMFASPGETLDVAEKLMHVFGTPAIIGVIVWLVRTYDGGQRALKAIQDRGEASATLLASTKQAVDTLQSNHLSHMADDIKALNKAQSECNTTLVSIDKNIAILADRGKRDVVVETKIKQV